jgi:magnesium transporter
MSVNEKKEVKINYVTHGKLSWYHIEKPTISEVNFLLQKFNFHPLDMDDVLSRVQRPKIDEYEDRVFIVLHFPVFDKENHMTRPTEIDMFIGENYVVTINKSATLEPLAVLFQECCISDKSRQIYLGKSSGFLLYHILDRLVNYCFPILSKVSDNIEEVEEIIFTDTVPKTIR